MSRNDLPNERAANFSARLRETLQTMLGVRGDKLDRVVTLRDLIESGAFTLREGVTVGTGTAPLVPGATPSTPGTYVPDLTPPPSPGSLTAVGAISHVLIEVPPATYSQGNGHLRTRVYGANPTTLVPLPTFSDAVEVGQFSGTVWALASNPSTTWHLWAKWETNDNVLSASPVGGTNGVVATTGADVSSLLDALAGEITATELASSLTTRIDLIDGTGTGSVAVRIAAETAARVANFSALAADILAETDTRAAEVALARSDLSTAIVAGDYAQASSTATLATQLRGGHTGTDLAGVTSGLLYQERVARVTQDDALATQITLLSAGAGEQFDYLRIWYFDTGVESWTGNGTPTAVAGWLRPANQVSGAYVESPTGIAADGNKYSQLRLRVRKVGSPTFAGFLWWRDSSDTTWDVARRETMVEPTFDSNGIGLINLSPGWTVTVDRIRVDLSSAQSSTDYFEMDWVAVGRPSPGASSAQVAEEQIARASADAALASSISSLSTTVAGNTSAIGTEATTRATADSTLASQITSLTSTVTGNTAAISAEATTRSTADSALSTQVTSLFAQFRNGPVLPDDFRNGTADWTNARAGDPAAVSTATGTVINNDTDFGRCLEISDWDIAGENILTKGVVTVAPGKVYRITSRFKVVSLPPDGSFSLNSVIPHLSDTYGNSSTTFATPLTISATGIYEITDTISNIAPLGGWAWVAGTKYLRAGLRMNSAESAGLVLRIQSIKFVDVTADQALAAAITTESTARASGDSALAGQITTLTTTVGGNTAAISTEAATRSSADSVLAGLITTLTSTVGGNTAAISTEATTRATQTGELYAQYTVKTDVAGLVSGYGLASTANNAAPTSSFGVRASNFFVAPPAIVQSAAPTVNRYKGMVWLDTSVLPNVTKYWTGSAWTTTPQALPFVIQTAPTTINGVVVQPGVYIENAYMAQLVATRGQIGLLAVDDARIANLSAAKLVAGSIAVGQYIQSTGYVAGSAGWRINGNGTAEFSGVVVRGTVIASAGFIGGSIIDATSIRSNIYSLGTIGWKLNNDGTGQLGGISLLTNAMQSTNYAAGTAGWRLGRDGSLEMNTGTFRGAVSGSQFTTGSISGYAWPPAGALNYGTYLGPSGLLIGNQNNGKYFQVTADGNIYAPGFNVVNGVLTIAQANIINSLNLAGNAVGASGFAAGVTSAIAASVSVPAGVTVRVVAIAHRSKSAAGDSGSGALSIALTGAATRSAQVFRTANPGDAGEVSTYIYNTLMVQNFSTFATGGATTVTATASFSAFSTPAAEITLSLQAFWK